MGADFRFDVFLSHSAKDKPIVRPLAERLRQDGLKVWFDESEAATPAELEDGLEHSRVLVLCMSANAFGSDWAQLESGTFRFRDSLSRDHHFRPILFDDAPVQGVTAHRFRASCRRADGWDRPTEPKRSSFVTAALL